MNMANSADIPISHSIDSRTKTLLTSEMQATAEELNYMVRVLNLAFKTRTSEEDDNIPSIVIDGFLYHGDLGHASDMKLLRSLDIRHIINTCDCPLPREIMDNFDVLWINIQDDFRTDVSRHFDETNKFLIFCQEKNEKVLVHCQAGVSRSSSVVLAYLIKYHRNNLFDAYDFLLNRCQLAAPNYGFLMQLIRYERKLRESRPVEDTRIPLKPIETPCDPNVTKTSF